MDVVVGAQQREAILISLLGLLLTPLGAAFLESASSIAAPLTHTVVFVGSWLDEQPVMGRMLHRFVGWLRTPEVEVPDVEEPADLPMAPERNVSPFQAPSTLSFLTSRYAVGLAALAILVNRIQHIVPPRRLFALRPWQRTSFRIPSMLLLTESLLLVAGRMPSVAIHMPARLMPAPVELNDLLWKVFVALAVNCITETFVRALDNERFTHPAFNIMSLGFMLHWHSVGPAELEPNERVYGLILLTLGETLSLVVMDAFALKLRFYVTGLYSVLGQWAMIRLLSGDMDGKDVSLLPALQYLNRLPELLFQVVACFTIACSVVAQLITERQVTFERTFGHSSTLPTASDDFATSIIRSVRRLPSADARSYGSACLETSALHGLGNELASISYAPYINLGRGSAGHVTLPPPRNEAEAQQHAVLQRMGGYSREVRSIRAKADRPDTSDSLSRSTSVSREAWTFIANLFKLATVLWREFNQEVGGLLGLGRLAMGDGRLARFLRFIGITPGNRRMRAFLRWNKRHSARQQRRQATTAPNLIEDDPEDDDFVPTDDESDGSESSSDEAESEPAPIDEGPLVLYGDLEQRQEAEAPAPPLSLMLAHLQHDGMLTRSRFGSDMTTALAETIAARRRHASSEADGSAADPAVCAVCRVESRSIVLWPCRCLVLCDDCRAHLASKAGENGRHLCVTCRTPVDGFSRIFLP